MRAEDIDGRIPVSTGELLKRLASNVDPQFCIVEIGAFKGRSTCFLAEGADPNTRIISIDAHGLPGSQRGKGDMYVGVREEYLRNIASYSNVQPVHALSHDAPLPDQPIGLLWIDGDHSYDACRGDVDRFGPLVVRGGHIVLDDYNHKNNGVVKVVHEMRKDPRWSYWTFKPKPVARARRAS